MVELIGFHDLSLVRAATKPMLCFDDTYAPESSRVEVLGNGDVLCTAACNAGKSHWFGDQPLVSVSFSSKLESMQYLPYQQKQHQIVKNISLFGYSR